MVGPGRQEAAFFGGLLEVRVVFLESRVDVAEGRGCGRGRANAEAEAVGLVGAVVGVLAGYDGFDGGEGGVAGPG